jgi:pimeloyl-ACP methyl ester carboxylesterase
MSYEALSNDIIALAQRVSPSSPVTLMGHSLGTSYHRHPLLSYVQSFTCCLYMCMYVCEGGRTAMAAALRRPDLFDRLIVVDMAPANYIRHDGWRGVADAMRALDLTKITSNTHAFAELGASIKV